MRNINDKFRELKELKQGDKVLITGGREMLFVRLKQTKFLATEDDRTYDVPVSMFEEVIEKASISSFDANTLTPGEFFYIKNSKSEAILFQFERHYSDDEVYAVNPITKTKVRIPHTMIKGTVESLTSTKSTITA